MINNETLTAISILVDAAATLAAGVESLSKSGYVSNAEVLARAVRKLGEMIEKEVASA